MRRGHCRFPCSLFLFLLAVLRLCLLSNSRKLNGKLLRSVRVLNIYSKFCYLLDMIAVGWDHIGSHIYNIVLNLCSLLFLTPCVLGSTWIQSAAEAAPTSLIVLIVLLTLSANFFDVMYRLLFCNRCLSSERICFHGMTVF